MAVMIEESCSVCKKRTKLTDRCVKCSLCNKLLHIKCLPVYSQNDIDYATNSDNWPCTVCLREIFPFFNLETNQDLLNCNNLNANDMDLERAKDLIFDPFEIIMDEMMILMILI
jgi:hypothetical protein